MTFLFIIKQVLKYILCEENVNDISILSAKG